jgi:ribosome-binding factor A
MPTQRQERVNSLLQEEISRILQQELQDEVLSLVTITGVQVSPDLHHARVYASVLGEEEQVREAMTTLFKRRKLIQRHLAESVVLRYLPRLTFVADRTAARAQRIEMLLQKVAQEPPLPPPRDEEEDAPPGAEED